MELLGTSENFRLRIKDLLRHLSEMTNSPLMSVLELICLNILPQCLNDHWTGLGVDAKPDKGLT